MGPIVLFMVVLRVKSVNICKTFRAAWHLERAIVIVKKKKQQQQPHPVTMIQIPS